MTDAPISGKPAVPAALWIAAFFLVSAILQLAQPVWLDADTGYHIAVGRLIKEHGLLHAFPWTPYSVMAERYADTELLFHLFFTATSPLSPDASSKLVGVIIETTLLSTLFAILRRHNPRLRGYWVLSAFVISGAFVIRFAIVRPHLISVLLCVLVLWAASERRWIVLALCCAIFPFGHLGWPSAIVLLVIAELAHRLCGRRAMWQPLALGLASLAVGLVLHPNFPAIAQTAWLEIGETLWSTAWRNPRTQPIGREFAPFAPLSFFKYVTIPLAITAFSLFRAVRTRKETPPLAMACAVTAAGFLIATVFSQRFVEYLVPFCVLAGAMLIPNQKPKVLAVAWIACALFTGWMSRPLYHHLINRTDMFPAKTTAILRQAIPENAQIFTCDWSFTGEMMLALPTRRFMVALNPLYFRQKDPKLYDLWLDTVYLPTPSPSAIIREKFKAHYVLCEERPQFRAFINAVARDPQTRRYIHQKPWWLFEL